MVFIPNINLFFQNINLLSRYNCNYESRWSLFFKRGKSGHRRAKLPVKSRCEWSWGKCHRKIPPL